MADEGVAQEHRDSDCDRLLGEVSWDDYVTCHHSEGDTAASIEHCGICSGSDAHLLEAASTVQNLLQGHCIRQAALAEQKTITDFFKSQ